MIYSEDYGDKPKCENCKFWEQKSDDETKGYCSEIPGEGIEIEINTGDGGGYVSAVITDNDFFCANFEN